MGLKIKGDCYVICGPVSVLLGLSCGISYIFGFVDNFCFRFAKLSV